MAKKTKKALEVKKVGKNVKWNVSKEYVDVVRNSLKLSEKQMSILDNVIEDEVKIMKDHFRKDGWDLDSSFYTDEVARQVLGNLNDYIRFQLLNKLKGIDLVFKNQGFVYTKTKPKKAAKKRKKS